ncbi:hypothetical protein CDAR_119341 [Caerostris darwini]|uniref:Uncharacterized protein n=1 Tax=Caerostris darwini TaxID=1538125 RepID=A0AAV4U4B4_9ARAC|nr:hypothetical protein CDAR_119341 [Caerostris darwini]
MKDSVKVRKNAFFVMDLIPPLQKSAHDTPLNKKYLNSSAETTHYWRVSVFHQTEKTQPKLKKSPNRKRQMINLVPPTNNPMQWDAGGSNASN